MMAEKKQEKVYDYEGFNLSMAAMDTLPVIFFIISALTLSGRFSSRSFCVGAVFVSVAGTLKVCWKFVLALAHKNVRFLNRQMRHLMPAGFALMLLGLIVDHRRWSISAICSGIFSFPAIIFFVLGAVGIGRMFYLARHNNQMNAHANWIEQWTNALTQLCFMIGILLA